MPTVMLIAGPNGSGKSTVATELVPAGMPYLNADDFAADLAVPAGPRRDLAAGRALLVRWRQLEQGGQSFAVETTLATRSFASRIASMKARGYAFELVFLYLPSADAAVARVAERVRRGGHSIPEPVIRRRYEAGLANLIPVYLPLAVAWRILDNSGSGAPEVLMTSAEGLEGHEIWERMVRKYSQG